MADPRMQLAIIPTPQGPVPFHMPREMDAATARCIGTGSFGTVISVKEGGFSNVVKKFKRPFESRDSALRVLREIFYLKELSPFGNRHVISYFGIYTSAADSQSLEDLYLVTDYCDTDLRKLLSDSLLPIEHIRHMSHTIASGIKFIHSAGILHRDLKPENIGVNSDGSTKIFDFGLSCGLHRGILNTRYVQTRYYRAPEVVCMSSYSEPSDWWSFGCILVEFFTASPLFPGQNQFNQVCRHARLFVSPLSPIRTIFYVAGFFCTMLELMAVHVLRSLSSPSFWGHFLLRSLLYWKTTSTFDSSSRMQ